MPNEMSIKVINDGDTEISITRVPIIESIGNFNPHFIRYKRKIYIVQGGVDYAYMHGERPLGIDYYIDFRDPTQRKY